MYRPLLFIEAHLNLANHEEVIKGAPSGAPFFCALV